MGLFSLDEKSPHSAAIAHATAHPELYVMKPQREGGGGLHFRSMMKRVTHLMFSGNNVYRKQLHTLLTTLTPKVGNTHTLH